MLRLVERLLLIPSCVAFVSFADASPQFSEYLRNYYTDYQVVKECVARFALPREDVAKAKTAMERIEYFYIRRDATINKSRLMKQAISNKDEAFKLLDRTRKIDSRAFCLGALNDIRGKSRHIPEKL